MMSTTSQPTLPFDVLECMVEIIATEFDSYSEHIPTIQSLGQLSQTCKSMVPLVRKYLFASVGLLKPEHCQQFCDLVANNPSITLYVRRLRYIVDDAITEHDEQVLELIKTRAHNLQYVSLWSHTNYKWDRIPELIRNLLESLVQLPSITHLHLERFSNLPASTIAGCGGLVQLSMDKVKISPSSSNSNNDSSHNSQTSAKIMNLHIDGDTLEALFTLVQLDHSHPPQYIIDFAHLKRAMFAISSPKDVQIMGKALNLTRQLESLEISVIDEFPLNGLGSILVNQASRTLKKFTLDLVIDGDDYDPLHCFNTEFQKISGSNILEMFGLSITVKSYFPCTGDSEEWSVLGAILSTRGAFPLLKKVSMEITWTLCSSEPPKGVLTTLKEKFFAQLVQNNGVELVTSESCEFCPQCGAPPEQSGKSELK